MSQENVEIVRRSFDAYRRGDLEAALSHAHPEIVWSPAEEAPMRGLEALKAYLPRWEQDWEELETTPKEFLDAGDKVVATVHFRGRGRGSGVVVDATTYAVYTLRDGSMIGMEEFTERAEALEAAGLSG